MDSLRQPLEIWIECANHEARVLNGAALMEREEVQTVLSEEHAADNRGKSKDLFAGHGSIRTSGFQLSQHVASQSAKLHHGLKREIGVRLEPGHQAESLAWIWPAISAAWLRT